MNNKKAKRAFVLSLLALMLCVSMLVGTTFAWFTDEAETGVNKVHTGTLKVGLTGHDQRDLEGGTIQMSQAKADGWDWVEMKDVDWEPGVRFELEPVTISNKGSLALKYKVLINEATALEEGDVDLAEVIDVYQIVKEEGKDNQYVLLGTLRSLINDGDGAAYGVLLPASETGTAAEPAGSVSMTLMLKMQENAGNEYQDLNLCTEGFSITVLATQYTYEYDSYGKDYDTSAQYPAA